jgi:hypothetical protein
MSSASAQWRKPMATGDAGRSGTPCVTR